MRRKAKPAHPSRPTLPFKPVKYKVRPPQGPDQFKINYKFLTEGVDEENDVDIPKARIYIWPQTIANNCDISGLLTNGVVRKRATFLVEKANYSKGLCMTATPEISPNGPQTVWTMVLEVEMFYYR